MKHYQALQAVLQHIFGLKVSFTLPGKKKPDDNEILVLSVSRTLDIERKEYLFSGEVSAKIGSVDLLDKTKYVNCLGNWSQTSHRIEDFEVLKFSQLVLSDYPVPYIKE